MSESNPQAARQEPSKEANAIARKIVGDYIVSLYGVPSTSLYKRMNGEELVKAIETALRRELSEAKAALEAAQRERDEARAEVRTLNQMQYAGIFPDDEARDAILDELARLRDLTRERRFGDEQPEDEAYVILYRSVWVNPLIVRYRKSLGSAWSFRDQIWDVKPDDTWYPLPLGEAGKEGGK